LPDESLPDFSALPPSSFEFTPAAVTYFDASTMSTIMLLRAASTTCRHLTAAVFGPTARRVSRQ
jgi:hypothetical protein